MGRSCLHRAALACSTPSTRPTLCCAVLCCQCHSSAPSQPRAGIPPSSTVPAPHSQTHTRGRRVQLGRLSLVGFLVQEPPWVRPTAEPQPEGK